MNIDQKVRLAINDDIENILTICNNLLIKNRTKESRETLEKYGFLIAGDNKEKWQETINDNKNCLTLVMQKEQEIIGYITGFDISMSHSKLQEIISQLLGLENLERKIFYYKQIAKKTNHNNVGKPLVLEMIKEISKRKYSFVVCQIIHKPFKNCASIAFHEKLGFKLVAITNDEDYSRGIYLKKLI